MIPLFGGQSGTVGMTVEDIGGYFGVVLSEPIIWTLCAVMIGTIAIVTLKNLPKDEEGAAEVNA